MQIDTIDVIALEYCGQLRSSTATPNGDLKDFITHSLVCFGERIYPLLAHQLERLSRVKRLRCKDACAAAYGRAQKDQNPRDPVHRALREQNVLGVNLEILQRLKKQRSVR